MEIKSLKISKANESDLAEILALQQRAFQENAVRYNDFHIGPLTQTLSELTLESKSHVILKAADGDKIIGSVRGCQKEKCCYIGRLLVHPDYQNRGIGRLLMAAVEEELEKELENELEKGAMTVKFELVTGHLDEKNIALYTKLGYRVCGEEKISDGFSFIHMEKERRIQK